MWEEHINWSPHPIYTLGPWIEPATEVRPLDWNQTWNPSVGCSVVRRANTLTLSKPARAEASGLKTKTKRIMERGEEEFIRFLIPGLFLKNQGVLPTLSPQLLLLHQIWYKQLSSLITFWIFFKAFGQGTIWKYWSYSIDYMICQVAYSICTV